MLTPGWEELGKRRRLNFLESLERVCGSIVPSRYETPRIVSLMDSRQCLLVRVGAEGAGVPTGVLARLVEVDASVSDEF